MPHPSRLHAIAWQLAAAPAAAVDIAVHEPVVVTDAERGEAVGLLTDEQMRAFVRDGLVALRLDDIPAKLHAQFYETALELDKSNTNTGENSHDGNTKQSIGDGLEDAMNTVFRSSKFRGALRSVLGPVCTPRFMTNHRALHHCTLQLATGQYRFLACLTPALEVDWTHYIVEPLPEVSPPAHTGLHDRE